MNSFLEVRTFATRRKWPSLVLVTACYVAEPAFSQELSLCGAPNYDPATEAGLFLWEENCGNPTRNFTVRVLQGGTTTGQWYEGRVDSDQVFGGTTPFSLETNDTLELLNGDQQIYYQMRVTSPWQDGFSFDAPATASACFGLDLPAGTTVRVGPDKTEVGTPFDLTTLGACSRPPSVCGAPAADQATDAGLFLWEENCGGPTHSYAVRAWQGDQPDVVTFEGLVTTDQLFSDVLEVSLETNDLLALLPEGQQIDYSLTVRSPYQDGFDFMVPEGANVCFGLDLPTGTQVRVGPDETLLSVPFDPQTMGPCNDGTNEPLNIVVILTDDERWDMQWSTPTIQALASDGISFSNAFVSYPVCGPVRASLISGGFRASNTGIISNNQGIARLADFNDHDTLALRLQQSGYQTFFTGKYLNGYYAMLDYVPPGWTRWVANRSGPTTSWYDFYVTIGSSDDQPSTGANVGPIAQYVTDYHRDEVLSFLDGVGDNPFFVYWSAFPPHSVATPDPGDESLFSDFLYRDRAWGETDLSDKPTWVTDPNRAQSAKQPDDEFHRQQLRSMQALDRSVGAIVDKVAEIGESDRTVFFVLSDNGYLWGEHGLSGKGVAYEESLRVPMVVFGAGISPGVEDRMVLADLDLGPTIMESAGLLGSAADGVSLWPLLNNEDPPWRDSMLFESWGNAAAGPFNTWAALRTDEWKYIQQANGEEELYDLLTDPYEEESLHSDPAFDAVRTDLAGQLEAQKSLALRTFWPPNGRIGVPYSLQLEAWGGSGSYRWIMEDGQLPDGLTLNTDTGLISGTPSVAGDAQVTIRVEDGTMGTHSGVFRQHRYLYRFTIN